MDYVPTHRDCGQNYATLSTMNSDDDDDDDDDDDEWTGCIWIKGGLL
jgi:hypothetical protein